MTVNSQTSRTVFLGTGSQTAFNFSWIGVATEYISALFTDASGNQTELTQGSATNQFQVTLNAAVQGAVWGLGGTVTYNPSGTPIPAGATLTVFRSLPLLQAISLANQASYGQYALSAEQADDLLEMQLQQVDDTIGRAIVANPANMVAPLPLPPAAQAANMGLVFDGTGNNVVAGAIPASGVISSAMQPVVNAASIAAGQAALGLLGQGLTTEPNQIRVTFLPAVVSTNQSVAVANHLYKYIATSAVTLSLAQSSTLWDGFGFWVDAYKAAITLMPHAGDSIDLAGASAAITVPFGCSAYVYTAGAGQWYMEWDTGPLNLLRYGADPTGVSDSSSAVTLWLAAGLNSRRNMWIPGGLYKDVPRTVDVGPSGSWVGFKIFGDGQQASTISIVGSGGWSFVNSENGGGAFYGVFEDFGIEGANLNGPVLKIGSDASSVTADYPDAFNTCLFKQFRVVNSAALTGTTVTISAANPAHVAWAAHGFSAGQQVCFNSTGSLPYPSGGIGIVIGAPYFVKTVVDANTFTIAASVGGAAISTSGDSQSGIHTGIAGWFPCAVHFNEVLDSNEIGCVWNWNGTSTFADGTAGLRCTQAQFNNFSGSLGGAGIGVHYTYGNGPFVMGVYNTGYNFGNVISGSDNELSWYAFQCDAPNTGKNLWLGGTLEQNLGGSPFNGVAGINNKFINSNIAQGVSFGSNGFGFVGIKIQDQSYGTGTPSFPLTTIGLVNNTGFDVTAVVYGGSVTGYSLLAPGSSPVDVSFSAATTGQITIPIDTEVEIAFTYTSSPSWVWFPR